MIIRTLSTPQKVEDLNSGSVFTFDCDVFILTNDIENNTAVSLKDGSIHHFSPVCEVEEKSAELILSEIHCE